MVTKQSSRTTEDSKSIVFKTALFLCGLVILTTILLQLYYLNVNPGFAIKYSYVTNIISPLTYSIVFIVIFLAYKKVKSDEERSSLCLWGIIFLIILLKNTYNHLNLPGDLRPGDRILSEIPLEVSGAIIGICCTYIFTKRFRLKILFIINLCVLLVLLSSVLFPLESYMRMIFQQILDSSVILAADLFLLSICF